jgi:hypothetical protein
MIQELLSSIPVAVALKVQDTKVTTRVDSSHVATTNDNKEPILQEPIETVVARKKELQQPHMEYVP